MRLRPINDHILIRRRDGAKKVGSIIIPDQYVKKTYYGIVIAVGPGVMLKNGTTVPVSVEPDEEVIFYERSGTEVVIDGVTYIMIRENDILAVTKGARPDAACKTCGAMHLSVPAVLATDLSGSKTEPAPPPAP